ncbi:hypothetical protein SH668x_001562 [Planctomicrobium sp. SH668]|uniref:hypothetical protein n=1 Tax=Planctomicrobium sp. SH668 TaxID=3448126 RepID=UPI003F5B0EBD
MMKSIRFTLLIVAGGVILLLVMLRERQLRHWSETAAPARAAPRQLAPRFQVTDHRRHLVKFERFLGRQRVALLFFDSRIGAANDPRVLSLLQGEEPLRRAGIEIVAISDANPHENQEAEKTLGIPFPFPLLTDIDLSIPAKLPVHRLYGLYDGASQQVRTGLFLIERDGTVPVGPNGFPLPVADEESAVEQLSQGIWPR